ncbi:hypothetical protein APSETT444_003452 [Aspergillus pseudonomiae]
MVSMPNDEAEQDRLDLFPSAKVIGNDLSPIQPSWVPPNVEFVVDDFENVWMHDRNYFDYVHARTISGCVQDWGRLMKQAYDHLKPNGYFECAEFVIDAFSDDGTFKQDSPYREYINNLNKAGEITGRPMNVATSLQAWMKNAGFTSVTEVVYVLPYGPWPKDRQLKEIGKWQYVQAPEGVEAYGLRLYTQVLGWPESEAKLHQALVKEQLRDRSLHIYGKLYVSRDSAFGAIQRARLPYTVIDVGCWYSVFVPKVPSGKSDKAHMPYIDHRIVEDGNQKFALTDIADVGKYVAQIVADPRTINKHVFAYTEVLSMHEIWDTMAIVTGEEPEKDYVSLADIHEIIETCRKRLENSPHTTQHPDNIMDCANYNMGQYRISWCVRGDNTPEYAEYLGYLGFWKLFPDFQKGTSLESFFRSIVSGEIDSTNDLDQ